MSSLVEQLSDKAVAIFETNGTPASASEKAVNLQLVKAALSDLDKLFNEAIWKTADRATSRDLQNRWQGLCKTHIHNLDNVIALRQQQRPSNQPQTLPTLVALPIHPSTAGGNSGPVQHVGQTPRLSTSTDQVSQSNAFQLLKQYSDRRQWTSAARVIRDSFSQNSQICSSAILPYANEVAKALTLQGNYADAQWIWKGIAEGLRENFGLKDQRWQEAARQLVRVLFKQNMIDSATRSARKLFPALEGESKQSVNAVKTYAVLAACYYKVNETDNILRAEPYAQLVWNTSKNEDVMDLGQGSCAGVILIRAAILRRDHQQATTIWRTMQANKQQERAFGRCTPAQLQDTKTAWLQLANDIEADAKRFVNATQWATQFQFSNSMEYHIRTEVGRWR